MIQKIKSRFKSAVADIIAIINLYFRDFTLTAASTPLTLYRLTIVVRHKLLLIQNTVECNFLMTNFRSISRVRRLGSGSIRECIPGIQRMYIRIWSDR